MIPSLTTAYDNNGPRPKLFWLITALLPIREKTNKFLKSSWV